MLRNKLMMACSVAVLTAALYGCSSSSDDGANMQVQDLQDQISALEAALGEGKELTPAALEALVSDLETANGRVTDLETMIGDEMDPAADSLRGMLAQANTDLQDAQDALLLAMDNSADEMVIADLRDDVTDAETMRDSYKTMLDTANEDLEMVKTELAGLKKDLADEIAAGALKDRIARANMVLTAIEDAAKKVPDDVDVTAKHSVAGAVTVDVNGDDDDVYEGGETTAGSGAWNSVVMTKTNSDANETTDTLVIYTDIEAPADKAFNKQYDLDTRQNILDEAARVKKAQSDSFPSGASQQLIYSATSGNPLSFSGTFDGVPGTYECTAAGDSCTLKTNGKGELQPSKKEDWTFSPNNNLATVKDPDVSYTYFGWWLNKPEKNTNPHDVEVFTGASAAAMAVNVTKLMEGTARYMGPAAGKYMTKTFTAGVQTEAGVGHFTATTKLTAKFGDDDDADASVSGTVTSFTLDDVTSVPWKVILESTTLNSGQSSFTKGTTEVDFGGGATDTELGGAGMWAAAFYDAAVPADENAPPNTVIGTFDAATTDRNASVIGAFGATKQ